jgi:hypothetical protein
MGPAPAAAPAYAADAPVAPSPPVAALPDPGIQDQDLPYREACAREGLNESECAGRLIWFKATAGNERFHTYTFQQRVGVLIDWFRVLRSDQRGDRFRAWGIINDPACCVPGSPDCPAKSLDETYGFDWCPGDEELLAHVGRPATATRPATSGCAALDPATPTAWWQGRPAPRRLRPAFRHLHRRPGHPQVPQPALRPRRWAGSTAARPPGKAITGRSPRHRRSRRGGPSHLQDGAIEPPFLIGTSCGSCHIAFDPLNPPADPAHPASGRTSRAWSATSTPASPRSWSRAWHKHARMADVRPCPAGRPATPRPSPTDQVNNPGTINALINVASARPSPTSP